jgi:hypothetical protein
MMRRLVTRGAIGVDVSDTGERVRNVVRGVDEARAVNSDDQREQTHSPHEPGKRAPAAQPLRPRDSRDMTHERSIN